MASKTGWQKLARVIAGMVLPALSVFLSFAAAQDEPQDEDAGLAREFLEEARSRYSLPVDDGLESFDMTIKVFITGEGRQAPRMGRQKRRGDGEPAVPGKPANSGNTIVYTWKKNSGEQIGTGDGSDRGRGTVQGMIRGLWKDIAAGWIFPDLEGEGATLEETDEGVIVTASPEKGPSYKVVFDAESNVIRRMVSSRKDVETITTPVYTVVEGGLRFEGRIVTVPGKGGDREQSYTYSGFQTSGGFLLPTRLNVGGGASETLFSFRYTCINGIEMEEDAVDIAALKTKIKGYEKLYPRADRPEKIHLLRELALLDHELPAMAIVKTGLKDKDLTIRAEAAKLLGQMGYRNVVSHLTNSLKPNHENKEVHLAIIAALGEIGDPKAIPYLYKDLWNQQERSDRVDATRAKIAALGRIESKKSVEALIDLLSKLGYGRRGSSARYVRNITESLQQLTGQNLGRDSDAWKLVEKEQEQAQASRGQVRGVLSSAGEACY